MGAAVFSDEALLTRPFMSQTLGRFVLSLVGHIRADAAKKLLLSLLKKEPFENEPPEFAKAMESAFRSIVANKAVGQAEILTLVAAGYVAASCPGVLRAD